MMLYIYYSTDEDEEFIEREVPFLSVQRREKLEKLRFFKDRLNCCIVYLLLRYGLAAEYGINTLPVFEYKNKGKPFLSDHPHIHFNMSHCKGAAACILSDSSTAVDVSELREVDTRLFTRVCSPEEVREVESSSDPKRMFIELWTRKECCTKLTGAGLSTDFRKVTRSLPQMDHIHTFEENNIIVSYYGENTGIRTISREELFAAQKSWQSR